MVAAVLTPSPISKVEFIEKEFSEDEIKITPTRINVLSERSALDSGVFFGARQSSKTVAMARPQTFKVSLEFELIAGAHGLTTENIQRAVGALVGLDDSKVPSEFEMILRRRSMNVRLLELKERAEEKNKELPQKSVSQDTPTTEPGACVW